MQGAFIKNRGDTMRQPGERRSVERVERVSTLLHREFMLAVNKPQYIEDKLADISADGLSFTSKHHYKEGELVEVRLMLWGWDKHKTEFYQSDPRKATDPLVALVKVSSVRAQPGGVFKVGGAFEAVDESHRAALGKYLEAQARGAL